MANTAVALDRTLFAGKTGLEQAKRAVVAYKKGEVNEMTPELWQAKKIVDSTLHPGIYITPIEVLAWRLSLGTFD